MKYAVAVAAVVAASAFVVSPASAEMRMCSGDHLSKMTTMVSGMPDGPRKSEMYKHLEILNVAMAKDGTRGCERFMLNMHRQHHMHRHHGHMHRHHHMRHTELGKKM